MREGEQHQGKSGKWKRPEFRCPALETMNLLRTDTSQIRDKICTDNRLHTDPSASFRPANADTEDKG